MESGVRAHGTLVVPEAPTSHFDPGLQHQFRSTFQGGAAFSFPAGGRMKRPGATLTPMHPIQATAGSAARSQMANMLAPLLAVGGLAGAPGRQISRPGFRPHR